MKNWDTMTEQELRNALKWTRTRATGFGYLNSILRHRRVPRLQYEELADRLYTIASEIVTSTILEYYPDEIPRTERDIKRELRLESDPIGILNKTILPGIREYLESLECHIIERGYRLPKWHRPEWLEEMEGRKYKGSG